MNFITREEAKEKIIRIKNESKPIKTGVKLPIDVSRSFNTYLVPLEYLVPNIFNDRIASRVKQYEADMGRELSFSREEDINKIFEFIEEEHKSENDNTLKDLAKKGQQRHGVISNDGIVLDGNRRLTLLRKLFMTDWKKYNKLPDDFYKFETVILDETYSKHDIIVLETKLQYGEDEKVNYNPINMYIKVNTMIVEGYSKEQIAEYLGEKTGQVETRLEVYKLMNDYLDYIDKKNMFTLLDGLEDHFLKINSFNKQIEKGTYNANWEYDELDLVDFQQVVFDYMRTKYEGKEFREKLLGITNKTTGIFYDEEVWNSFKEEHNIIKENGIFNKIADWETEVNKNKFKSHLSRAHKKLDKINEELSIKSCLNGLESNLDKIEKMIKDKQELDEDDIKRLNYLETRIYKIKKEF